MRGVTPPRRYPRDACMLRCYDDFLSPLPGFIYGAAADAVTFSSRERYRELMLRRAADA